MSVNKYLSFALVLFLLTACNSKPKVDLSEFVINDRQLKLEQIAAEPLLSSAVAMSEDQKGRWWVVEMNGYMRDIDGSNEDIPDGNIAILTDSDGDGALDTRQVFLDKLLNPRAISLVYGGLLFTDGVALKWTTIEGDKPGEIEVVDPVYVIGGNIEHQPNGLLYNLDNWIYSAKSSARYQKKDGKWLKEPTSPRGQWGLSMDLNGRLIYNHNSAPILGDYAQPNLLISNPYQRVRAGIGALYTKNMRVYPFQATSVNRGYQPGVLDDSLKLVNYTSACSPHLLYSNQLGADYAGNAFVCAPEINSVVTYKVDPSQFELNATRMSDTEELLYSKDETFRPVNLYTGFDGALYILDLRKGIIQHSAYMTSYLREKILSKGLEQVNGKGRIYKLSSKKAKSKSPKLEGLSTEGLIDLLSSENLSLRMYAQKTLVHQGVESSIQPLKTLAKAGTSPLGQVHALWTLEGMDSLDEATLLAASQNSEDPNLWQHVLTLTKKFNDPSEAVLSLWQEALAKDNAQLDLILAHVAGQFRPQIWMEVAGRHAKSNVFREALISGIHGKEPAYLGQVKSVKAMSGLETQLKKTQEFALAKNIQAPQLLTETYDDTRTNGIKFFKNVCSSCHGMDGNGLTALAPSLVTSEIIEGDQVDIAAVILNGYQSDSSEFAMAMPGYMNDKNMSDQDVVDIINYLKSAFALKGGQRVSLEQVDSLRQVKTR